MNHKDRLSIDQLRAERCYTDLTPKQKTLVETFISTNGDRIGAVQTAYSPKSRHNAQIIAAQVFANIRVIAALAAYFQSDPLEDFKAEVRKAYRDKKVSVAQVNALKLLADLSGWTTDSLPKFSKAKPTSPAAGEVESPRLSTPAPATKQKYAVGDIFTQKGVQYRVTKLDANGEIDDAEDVV